MDTPGWVVLGILAVLVLLLVYGLPTYIAFKRNHHFKWIILAINVILGASGIGWLIAFVWAVWPQDKSLADPLLGNPTGTGRRNSGHTLGEMRASAAQTESSLGGAGTASAALDAIDRLSKLAERGAITPEEFSAKKATLLNQV
jgi:hypothetical protein